jgi:hypothetical protein
MTAVFTFSDPTIGRLVDLASSYSIATKDTLTLMLRKADLARFAPRAPDPNTTKIQMLLGPIDAANRAADQGDAKAHQSLLGFVLLVVAVAAEAQQLHGSVSEQVSALAEALRADGYELRLPTSPLDAVQLLPTEPSAAPLPPEITALEVELDHRGYDVTLNHYRQAVDNLVGGNYEAANAALRTSLEDLVTRLAAGHNGYQPVLGPNGEPKANQGGRAIEQLVDKTNKIPADDGGALLRGLWKMSCTKGSHPGRSSADEARSRLQLVTATARIVLGYFPA